MQYLGIDPGKSGGAALIDIDNNVVHACYLSCGVAEVRDWLNEVANLFSVVATVEDVHAFPAIRNKKDGTQAKQGVTSAFTFGRELGKLEGLLTGLGIGIKYVTPQRWQRGMFCLTGGNKNISKNAAQQMFPSIKVTHAIADALLIAEYGRLNLWQ